MKLVKKLKPEDLPEVPASEVDFRMVSVDDLEPNDYNPNEMEAEYFETLTNLVKEEGMPQPVLCRPKPGVEGKFLIVDGEHRWKSTRIAGRKLIAAVVVQMDEKTAKLRTLSMNNLRGQNIPIKLARLLVDLHKEYSAQQIRSLTGIGEEDQQSVLDLLKVPDFKPSDGVSISASDVARPIQVPLMLMPDEHGAYTGALKKAMKLMGDDVTALIGHEVADYDVAMKAAMGIAGVKLRNVGLAVICATFVSLPKAYQDEIGKKVHKMIYDKVASDATAKEAKKQASDKAS
jgi:ParB/RepB/Spo0J family partition protein